MKTRSVLVVDDEPQIAKVVSLYLGQSGFTCKVANSGKAAIEMLKEEKFDLVLTDVRMPNGDGFFLLNQIKDNLDNPPLVVFMTGFSDVSDKEAIRQGARAVFEKPFESEQMVSQLKSFLDSP